MSEEKIRKILGEFQSYDGEKFEGKYIISYKQPNSQDPSKVWNHQAIDAELSDDAVRKLISASAGERLCFHQGSDGKYPVIRDITDAKDADPKPTGGKAQYKKNDYKPKDESGVAVGAAWTNAIEIAKLCKANFENAKDAVDYISNVVTQVLKSKLAQEDKLRAAKLAKEETKAKEDKPLSRADKMKAELEAKKAAEKPKPDTTKTKDPEPEPETEDEVDPLDKVDFGDDE